MYNIKMCMYTYTNIYTYCIKYIKYMFNINTMPDPED